jgi:anti-sigma factor RsiW
MTSELNCNDCADWLHPYLDNELETEMAVRVNMHIAKCASCKARFAELQTLRDGIRQHAPYYPAPELIQQRIMSQINRQKPAFSSRQWLAPAFSATALAASIMLYLAMPSSQDMLMEEVVSSHVRSLQEQHLMDVASTDKHTVKPWFNGKIDFAPPVYDFAEQGYPLIGGRLDYIRHQNVAALSYHRNKHVINLFVIPNNAADAEIHAASKRGFNIVSWQKNNMAFEAVSDLNGQELQAFAQMIISQH